MLLHALGRGPHLLCLWAAVHGGLQVAQPLRLLAMVGHFLKTSLQRRLWSMINKG
ncbi:hypothetical protein ACO0K9_24810 [Undibacterium sp. Ji50W]|uniref:hypothetical protein n=1 Tax=Undibacterium sp. Ji50W TaxID=3413041 RepID=UPI003BF3C3C8